MSRVDCLHQVSKGTIVPISRKMVQHIMRLSHVLPRMIPSFERTPTSRETIMNRYGYARRYLQLTDDSRADICFLG
jgi:hypothetical protein